MEAEQLPLLLSLQPGVIYNSLPIRLSPNAPAQKRSQCLGGVAVNLAARYRAAKCGDRDLASGSANRHRRGTFAVGVHGELTGCHTVKSDRCGLREARTGYLYRGTNRGILSVKTRSPAVPEQDV